MRTDRWGVVKGHAQSQDRRLLWDQVEGLGCDCGGAVLTEGEMQQSDAVIGPNC